MPLTAKGEKMLAGFKDQYGTGKGERVFYATLNSDPKLKALAEPSEGLDEWMDYELGGVKDLLGNPYTQGMSMGDDSLGEDEDFRPQDLFGPPGYYTPMEAHMSTQVEMIVEDLLGEVSSLDWKNMKQGTSVVAVVKGYAMDWSKNPPQAMHNLGFSEPGVIEVPPNSESGVASIRLTKNNSIVKLPAYSIALKESYGEANDDDNVEITDAEKFLDEVYEMTTAGGIATFPKGFSPNDLPNEDDTEQTGIGITPQDDDYEV